jgi:hypothetical protein
MEVSGIGQLIEIKNSLSRSNQVPDQIRTNEPSASGYQNQYYPLLYLSLYTGIAL